MQLMRFRIYTDGPTGAETPDTADLTVLPADRMRAERASTAELAPSQRGPGAAKAHPETWVLLWLWCAATRVGLTSAGFADWATTVLDYDRLDADGQLVAAETAPEDVEHPAVDPTQLAGPTR